MSSSFSNIDEKTVPSLEDYITWQEDEDERERVRVERHRIAEHQKLIDASLTVLDQRIFGIYAEADRIHFAYRGQSYNLTYSPERENWQVRRSGEPHPFLGGIPKHELRVGLLRMLSVEQQRLVNS